MTQTLIEQGEERRKQMVSFIQDFTSERGFSPTIAEIGKAVGVNSPNAVRNHLLRLQEEGLLTMQPFTPRSISLTNKGKRFRA